MCAVTPCSSSAASDFDFDDVPRSDIAGITGHIYPIGLVNDTLYLAGSFAPNRRPPIAAFEFDAATGRAVSPLGLIQGTVNVIISDGSGGFFIGGNFLCAESPAHRNLIHLLSNLKLDVGWRPDPNGEISLLVRQGTMLYFAGSFESVGEQARLGLAAVDQASGAVMAWNPAPKDHGSARPYFRKLLANRHTVYVDGIYGEIGGSSRAGLVALDPVSGRAKPWQLPIELSNNAPTGLLAVDEERVFIYSGIRLWVLDARTGIPHSWNALNYGTRAFSAGQRFDAVVHCGRLYISGGLGIVGVGPFGWTYKPVIESLGALDLQTGAVSSWKPRVDNNFQLNGMVAHGNRLFVIRSRGFLGEVAIDAYSTQGELVEPSPVINDVAAAPEILGEGRSEQMEFFAQSYQSLADRIAISGSRMVVAAKFPLHDTGFLQFAAFDTRTAKFSDWGPHTNRFISRQWGFDGRRLYVLAQFEREAIGPGGAVIWDDDVASVDLPSGRLTRMHLNFRELFRPPENVLRTSLTALCVTNGYLYLGGEFQLPSGNVFPDLYGMLACVDLATGLPIWRIPNTQHVLSSLHLHGDTLFAVGTIRFSSTAVVRPFSAQDGTSRAWRFLVNGTIDALDFHEQSGFLTGNFSLRGSAAKQQIVRMDLATGSVQDWGSDIRTNLGIHGSPAIFVRGDVSIFSGAFDRLENKPRRMIAALDTASGAVLPWAPDADGMAGSATFASNSLVVTGGFNVIGGRHSPGFAVFPLKGFPRVAHQSSALAVEAGTQAEIEVLPAGREPLLVQWHFNGVELPQQTNRSLVIPRVLSVHDGLYQARLSNTVGSVLGAPIRLTVFSRPQILSPPVGGTVMPGGEVVLSISATAHPPPTYQWQLNGVNIPGATSRDLVLQNLDFDQSGRYTVLVGNAGGALRSAPADVLLDLDPLRLTDSRERNLVHLAPNGAGVGSNEEATIDPGEPLHAGKHGGRSVWFHWRALDDGIATFSTRGSPLDTLLAAYVEATNGTLVAVASDDDGAGFLASRVQFQSKRGQEYWIAVAGFGGAAGKIVLHWTTDPGFSSAIQILAQPESYSIARGGVVHFQVSAVGPPPLSYQWYHECIAIPGATNAALTISNVIEDDLGFYSVRVASAEQTVESEYAYLEIGPDPKVLSHDKFLDLFEAEASPRQVARSAPRTTAPHFVSVTAGFGGVQLFRNEGSSLDAGEPLHAGYAGGASRWLRFKSVQSGVLELDTFGSEADTVLAVYTGTSLLDLRVIASDYGKPSNGYRAKARFESAAGVDYLVAVDSMGPDRGLIRLSWRIVDGQHLAFEAAVRPTRVGTGLTLSGPRSEHVVVEYSTNLTDWSILQTFTPFEFSADVPLTQPAQGSTFFYRARAR